MPEVTFLEKLQTPADIAAEEIRASKEESSLYGAKWLTAEEVLTDEKGYAQFCLDNQGSNE